MDAMISRTRSSQSILPSQQAILQHRAPKQRHTEIAHHDGMAGDEPRRILAAIYVTDDHALQIRPAHRHAQRDAALVHSLGVVRQPGHRVRYAGVDAHAGQEGAGVFGARREVAEQDPEADHPERGDGDGA